MKKVLFTLAALLSLVSAIAQEGEIIYTDYEPNLHVYTPYSFYSMDVDLDFDSIPDVQLYFNRLEPAVSDYAILAINDDFEIAQCLEGDVIPDLEYWASEQSLYFESQSMYAFRQQKGNGYCYGWIRAYCGIGNNQGVFLDAFAYCNVVNYPLRWGQTELPDDAQWNQMLSPVGDVGVSTLVTYDNKSYVCNDYSGTFVKETLDAPWKNIGQKSVKQGLVEDGILYGLVNKSVVRMALDSVDDSYSVIHRNGFDFVKSDGTYLYGGNQNDGFVRMLKDGSNFEIYSEGLPGDSVYMILEPYYHFVTAVYDATYLDGYYYCITEKGIYRCSEELNEPWQYANQGLADTCATLITQANGVLYAAIGDTLYSRTAETEYWQNINSYCMNNAHADITTVCVFNGRLYVGYNDGIVSVFDGTYSLRGSKVTHLTCFEGYLIAGTDTEGTFRQMDQFCARWQNANLGFAGSPLQDLVRTQNSILAADKSTKTIYRLESFGAWENVTPDLCEMESLGSLVSDGQTLYFSFKSSDTNRHVVFSNDLGETWQEMLSLPSFANQTYDPIRIKALGNALYAWYKNLIAYTVDFGQTWQELTVPSNNLPSQINISDLEACGQHVFVAESSERKLYRTDGDNLTQLEVQGLPDAEIRKLVSFNEALYAFLENGICFVSHDLGNSFSNANAPESLSEVTDSETIPNGLLVSTTNGIFGLNNDGSWAAFNEGMSDKNSSSIAVCNDMVYATIRQQGVWYRNLSHFCWPNYEAGSEWFYEILNDDGSITYQHLQCSNDTVIENKRPKIIIRSNTLYDEKMGTVVTHEYVYEENGIVYWWNKTLNEFTVLYNLNAEAGDEWQIKVGTETITVHVDAVDDYDYEGRTYKMLQVSDENDVFSGTIVCGIGHLTSFFPERLMSKSGNYRVEGMRCYWKDGELVFKYGDKDCDEIYIELHNGIEESDNQTFSVYPNPAKGFITIETEEENAVYEIVNIMGQTVFSGSLNGAKQVNVSGLSDGMYFIKVGQKTVKFVVGK